MASRTGGRVCRQVLGGRVPVVGRVCVRDTESWSGGRPSLAGALRSAAFGRGGGDGAGVGAGRPVWGGLLPPSRASVTYRAAFAVTGMPLGEP